MGENKAMKIIIIIIVATRMKGGAKIRQWRWQRCRWYREYGGPGEEAALEQDSLPISHYCQWCYKHLRCTDDLSLKMTDLPGCLYPFFGPRSLMNPALTGSTEPCLCEEFTIWLRFPKTLISWTCYLADTSQAAKQWRACAPSQFCQFSEKGLYSWAKLNCRRQMFF